MTTRTLLSTLSFGLVLAGCSSSTSITGGGAGTFSLANSYESTRCFKNKAATQGMGSDVYTQATLTLNADQSGTAQFSLYSDAACSSLLGAGSEALHYETARQSGAITVIKVDQGDPLNGGSTYYLAFNLIADGAYIHIDGERTDEVGPHASEPSDADIAAFIADPAGVGVLFRHP